MEYRYQSIVWLLSRFGSSIQEHADGDFVRETLVTRVRLEYQNTRLLTAL